MKIETYNELDQIANLDIGGKKNRYLYQAARNTNPLCLESAKLIKKSLEENKSTVIITSGFPIIPKNKPETDGPPGAIAFAKAMQKLNVTPILVSGELCLNLHQKLSKNMGLKNLEFEKVSKNLSKAKAECSSIIDEYEPDLLLSIERPGRTKGKKYFNMHGKNITELVGKIDPLFIQAMNKNIPTIGVGDGGNEIGMGNIIKAVKENIPKGETIASTTKVKSLMVSAVSNWGVYSILAALSFLTGEELVHNSEFERELIESCVKNGAIDSVTKKAEHKVDGVPKYLNENIVEIIQYLSQNIKMKN